MYELQSGVLGIKNRFIFICKLPEVSKLSSALTMYSMYKTIINSIQHIINRAGGLVDLGIHFLKDLLPF